MVFRLANVPATFYNLMNAVFVDYIDRFIVVYQMIQCIMSFAGSIESSKASVCSPQAAPTLYQEGECEFAQKEFIIPWAENQ